MNILTALRITAQNEGSGANRLVKDLMVLAGHELNPERHGIWAENARRERERERIARNNMSPLAR